MVPEDEGPWEVLGFGDVLVAETTAAKSRFGDGVGVACEGREGDGADGAFAIGRGRRPR